MADSAVWKSSAARKWRRAWDKGMRLALKLRMRRRRARRVWIDVGAHEGEVTMRHAAADPTLMIYAFEPNLPVALRTMGRLRNFVVLPMAVAQEDGSAELFVNQYEASSSLLPVDELGAKTWVADGPMGVVGSQIVPTIRLDTFMNAAQLGEISFLKIDAQGADLDVVKSAGARLKDVRRVQLEVTLPPHSYYQGAPTRDEVVEFMREAGFRLVREEAQSHGQEANLHFVR